VILKSVPFYAKTVGKNNIIYRVHNDDQGRLATFWSLGFTLFMGFSLPSFPSSPFPFPSLSFPFPSFSPAPLISTPLKYTASDLGERCKLPSGVRSGAPAQRKSKLVHFSLKICHLVTQIIGLLIFLRINWPRCMHTVISHYFWWVNFLH